MKNQYKMFINGNVENNDHIKCLNALKALGIDAELLVTDCWPIIVKVSADQVNLLPTDENGIYFPHMGNKSGWSCYASKEFDTLTNKK